MQFSEILGQEHIKNHLTKVQKWEIPMHNYFCPGGSGTLAMATAHSYILWQSKRRKLGF
jgi:DNA polymerase-3 subunit delta'